VDLTASLRWDTWLRYTSAITALGIPAYTALDLRLAWRPSKNLELSVVGQNLLDSVHPEILSDFILSTPTEIQRGVYVRADWKF
jgi:iron complex outermembrane receptor protein